MVNDHNPVSRPEHYARGGIEPIDLMMSQDMNGLQCNIIKYTGRYKYKDGMKDLKKAMQYLVWLMLQEMFAEEGVSWHPNKDFPEGKVDELAVHFINTMQGEVNRRTRKVPFDVE